MIYAVPGGLIGVGLTIDPFLTRGDRLVGRVIIIIYNELLIILIYIDPRT